MHNKVKKWPTLCWMIPGVDFQLMIIIIDDDRWWSSIKINGGWWSSIKIMVVDDHDDENSTGFLGSSCGFQVMPKFAARPTSTQPGATSPTNFSHERQKYKNYKIQKQTLENHLQLLGDNLNWPKMFWKSILRHCNFCWCKSQRYCQRFKRFSWKV